MILLQMCLTDKWWHDLKNKTIEKCGNSPTISLHIVYTNSYGVSPYEFFNTNAYVNTEQIFDTVKSPVKAPLAPVPSKCIRISRHAVRLSLLSLGNTEKTRELTNLRSNSTLILNFIDVLFDLWNNNRTIFCNTG